MQSVKPRKEEKGEDEVQGDEEALLSSRRARLVTLSSSSLSLSRSLSASLLSFLLFLQRLGLLQRTDTHPRCPSSHSSSNRAPRPASSLRTPPPRSAPLHQLQHPPSPFLHAHRPSAPALAHPRPRCHPTNAPALHHLPLAHRLAACLPPRHPPSPTALPRNALPQSSQKKRAARRDQRARRTISSRFKARPSPLARTGRGRVRRL